MLVLGLLARRARCLELTYERLEPDAEDGELNLSKSILSLCGRRTTKPDCIQHDVISVLQDNEAQNSGPDGSELGQLPDRREPTVAVAVRRTALDKTMLYPSCKRTKLKTAVRTVLNSSESSAKN